VYRESATQGKRSVNPRRIPVDFRPRGPWAILWGMRRLPLYLALALVALALPLSSGAIPLPVIAYDTNTGAVNVALEDGSVTASAADISPYFSLSGGVMASSRTTLNGGSRVVGIDGSSGSTLFTVNDGFFPLISGDGGRVVFLPDGRAGGAHDRDPTINSVWYYDVPSDIDHRLVRFSDSDRIPLNLAISPKGGRVAITHGNDADLFVWDIWTARTDTHLVRRLTTDGISNYPSFSPSGLQIAFTKIDPRAPCSGSVWIMAGDGTRSHRVATASCARHFLRPVWLDAHTLIAWAWGSDRVLGLVKIALPSRTVTPIITGRVLDFSVSRTMGKVAIRYRSGRIGLWDAGSSSLTLLPVTPEGGRVFLEGGLELAY
jgi:WD40 repeat protein